MESSQHFEPGREVGAGRFTIERVLGKGGMGVVCQAHDQMLNKTVALKFLSPEIQSNSAALEAMRNETRKSLELTHPNIVRIYDFHHFADELPFISMEYIEGITIAYLKSEQPNRLFSWDMMEPLMHQLCAALSYAHHEGIIHRDLKPANMMLDQNQRLRIADFGLSVTAGDPEENSEMGTSGTPCYMSPQQIVGVPSQASDDVYALGATLYELLTSQPPFYKGDVLLQVRDDTPPLMADRLAELGRENEIPTFVEKVVMDCLEKDPDRRPQSIEEIAERLGTSDFQSTVYKNVKPNKGSKRRQSARHKNGYQGKSALGPVAAFCFVAVAAALLLNKFKTEEPIPPAPPQPAPKQLRTSDPISRSNPAKPLDLSPLLRQAEEVRLLSHVGRTGSGSAANYNRYPLLPTSPRWRIRNGRLVGSVKAPSDPQQLSTSQLFLSIGQAGDFLLGFAWKTLTGASATPTVHYRCLTTQPAALDAADITLDGISVNPETPDRIHFQGLLPPYRINTTAQMTVGSFSDHDWKAMGELEIDDLVAKLSGSPMVRGGGDWIIIQCRGDELRHIINGRFVADLNLRKEAEASSADNRRKLLDKHRNHPTTLALGLTAGATQPHVEVEFGEFYFRATE